MKFQILGPVSVADDGGQLKLDGPRLKALLAYLLLHANRPVSTSELLEALWGEEQPRSGVAAVQNAVVRLRRTFGDRIVTAGSGYLVRVEPGELDLDVFRELVERAGTADPANKVALLREALGLWNGNALDGIESAAFATRESAALEDERLTALVSRVDAELDLGRNAELVPLLSGLAAEHPLDERLRAQLIVALYRAGRQAAALDVYRETRRLLMDELGLEPGQALRDLERAVLTQDPSLDYQPAFAPGLDPAQAEVPIPADVPTPETEPASERRKMRWALVVTSLGALAIAGVALGVALTREESAASGPTTILRVTQTSAQGSTTVRVVTTVRKTGTVDHASSSSQGATTPQGQTEVSPATTAAAQPPPVGSTPTATTTTATTTTRATPAATTTNVTRTTPKSTTTKATPPPTRMYWLADDFSQPGTDADLWQTAGHGAGVTGAEQNGRLEFSVGSAAASDSTTTGFDQRYGTQCLLTGDFDATVDYQLLDWPTKNGMRLGFGLARAQPNELFDIERHGAPADGGVEGYTASGGGFAQTSDVSGAFRLKRTGPWLSMYYRHRDRWVSLGAVRAPGAGQLVLMFAGSDSQFGRQPASSALDRFAAAADTVRCPGSSLPPRKARA